jgi:hypothetical protein
MDRPLVSFYQMVSGGRPPRRASKDVQGTLPVAALRHCKPVQESNEFGYDLFLPFDIALRWDGATGLELSYDVDGTGVGAEWIPLSPECHYPGFADFWAQHAPEDPRLDVPPFVTMTQDYGLVQVWSGVVARTREDWSLWVRGPVNDSRRSLGYDVLEGIISTDRFGGPIPTILRLLKVDAEIYIPAHQPFLRVIPIYRPHYDNRLLDQFTVGEFKDVPPERWRSYAEWRSYVVDPERRRQGGYISAEMRRWTGKGDK